MQPMMINYLLLAISGLYVLAAIIVKVKTGNWLARRPFRAFLMLVVFILALVATIMNIPITELQTMIEQAF